MLLGCTSAAKSCGLSCLCCEVGGKSAGRLRLEIQSIPSHGSHLRFVVCQYSKHLRARYRAGFGSHRWLMSWKHGGGANECVFVGLGLLVWRVKDRLLYFLDLL